MSRCVLLVASKVGYQTHAFDEAAARLGIELTLATDRCHMLDDPWRDRAIAVQFDQPARLEQRFDGVVAVGDRPAEVAAYQGLRFHPLHAVQAARNKFLARQRFADAGLLTPWFFRVPPMREPTFPCVLKPLGLSGSRGVIRANNAAEFKAALARIRKLLDRPEIRRMRDEADRFIQVEEYIPGREFAVEGLVRDGRLQVLAVFDKPDPLEGPFFEETIYVTTPTEPALLEVAQRAINALSFTDGPVHAEFRWNERGVWPLEVAARPIGGMCARALPGLEEAILRHALGEDVTLEVGNSGVMMIPIPRRGVYQAVEGLAQALAVPLVTDIEITAKVGQLFEPLPEGASYLGFIFARGGDPGSVEKALRAAHGCLRFDLAEALTLA